MQTVVCFGDSITAGLVSANYVEMLEERLGKDGFEFINEGVNNDLTYNLLERVDEVIDLQPKYVTILIGTNDVISSLSFKGALYNIIRKRLPRWPVLVWSYANLLEIIQRLKNETTAQIALVSIPLLGEDVDSLAIQRVREYNESIERLAQQEGIGYIPLFERQLEYLRNQGVYHGKAFDGSKLPTLELIAWRLFKKESFDAFSARMGYILLTDGVHMNRKGGELIADEIEKFLRARKAEIGSARDKRETAPPLS